MVGFVEKRVMSIVSVWYSTMLSMSICSSVGACARAG